jgi:hypothetical protein
VFDSRSGRTASLLNQPAALADWAARIEPGYLVVREATGGYEAALLAAVPAAGLPAHRADARKVKAFIRSFGTLGKTDAIDARTLAGYGARASCSARALEAKRRRMRPAARSGDDPNRPGGCAAVLPQIGSTLPGRACAVASAAFARLPQRADRRNRGRPRCASADARVPRKSCAPSPASDLRPRRPWSL